MSTVRIQGAETVDALAGQVEGVNPRLLASSMNRVMDRERTAVRRAVAEVTGAPYRRVMTVTRTIPAGPGRLAYVIEARDSYMSLADFGARETRNGVSAAPWGQRKVFGGAFMRGGRFPNRVDAMGLNGQVFRRDGSGRLPISRMFGPLIPKEMLQGEPLHTWEGGVLRLVPELVKEVRRRIEAGA